MSDYSKQYFAFEWEKEEGGKIVKQQLTWTVLLQGYTESLVLFGQAFRKYEERLLHLRELGCCSMWMICFSQGNRKGKVVEEVTLKLLNFLARKRLRGSEKAAQLVEKKVKYLRHILTGGLQCIDPEIIPRILQVPLPQTKKELQQFLGLVRYCRAWTEDYSALARPLYDFLTKTVLML